MSFQLTELDVRLHETRFRFAYSHALAERECGISVLVRAKTDTGAVGFGETLVRSYLTGETLASVQEDIAAWWPDVRTCVFHAPECVLEELRPYWKRADAARKTAAWAGLELAVIDAVTRAMGVPAWRVLADAPQCSRIDYVAPLGFRGMRKTRWAARLLRWLGFRDFKLKTGWPDDRDRLRAVRAIIGRNADLHVDANTGWTPECAFDIACVLHECGVSAVEQPFPAGAESEMADFQRKTGLAVMADESLCTTTDARRLIALGACRLLNLRLAKCGGFSGCKAILDMARAAGIACQLGALVGETSVLTAAGRHFIIGCGPLAHHEQSFPRIFLKSDPARGARSPWWGGAVCGVPSEAGLGVRVRFGTGWEPVS